MPSTTDHRDRFPVLSPERAARWSKFLASDENYFPEFVGLRVEEIREGYARVRLPYRRELNQPGGVVHGGAIATLIDTVVVPAIGSSYAEPMALLTVDMHIQFMGAVAERDAIAEGWVEKRGRSLCFCRVEVRTDSGDLAATGALIYRVRSTG